MTMRRLGVLALAVALVAPACSSPKGRSLDVATMLKKGANETASGGVSGESTVAGETATGGTSGGSAAGASAGAAGGSSTAGGSSGALPSGLAGGSSGSAGGAGASGSSEAAGTIRIGIHVSKDLQAAYTALGAKGAEGDLTPGITKVVEWINAHGGMAGRKVEAFFHASDPLNGTFDAEGQATCSDFADDKHVFAVVSGAVLPTIVTADCLARKHVPLVWNYHYLVDTPIWQKYLPYLYMPFSMNADRMTFYVDQLASNGFFDQGARVAIVRYDLPQHARFSANVIKPRLAAHNIQLVDEVAVRPPDAASSAGDTGAQISNAILRLRAENVSHIVFVPTGGAVPFLFMSSADGQGYRPRYGMNSLDIPYFVADQAPARQLHGALAVGWSPASDVEREQAPAPNRSQALCYQLTNSPGGAQRFCDGLFFLKTALDRAGRVDAASLQNAVESLGNGFEPTFSLADTFARGRHDGASAIRMVAFDDGCGCFRYSGPVIPIG